VAQHVNCAPLGVPAGRRRLSGPELVPDGRRPSDCEHECRERERAVDAITHLLRTPQYCADRPSRGQLANVSDA